MMPERQRESASGSGGTEPASQRGTPSPDAKPSPVGARHALGRMLVTPTFVAGACIVLIAALAYGTTQTHLLYSGQMPACAAASCSAATPQEAGGIPFRVSATPATGDAQGSGSRGTGQGQGAGGAPNASSGPQGSQAGPGAGYGGWPAPTATATASSPTSRVIIVYRSLQRWRGGFLAAITISNHGRSAIAGWQMWMRYRADRIDHLSGARWFPASPKAHGIGLVAPRSGQQSLRPGASVRFVFRATGLAGPPSGCAFDGDPCSFGQP